MRHDIYFYCTLQLYWRDGKASIALSLFDILKTEPENQIGRTGIPILSDCLARVHSGT